MIERVIEQTDTSISPFIPIICFMWTIWLVPEIIGGINAYLNPVDISAIIETINTENIINTIADNTTTVTDTTVILTHPTTTLADPTLDLVPINTATATNNLVLATVNINVEEIIDPMLDANIYNIINPSTGIMDVIIQLNNSEDANVTTYPLVGENIRDIETYNLKILSKIHYTDELINFSINNVPQNLDDLRSCINTYMDRAVTTEWLFEEATSTANALGMGDLEGEAFQMEHLERWKACIRIIRHLEQILRLYDSTYQSTFEQTWVED